jgi:TRAP-type C4-dicarboxylate transport system permease small subunit
MLRTVDRAVDAALVLSLATIAAALALQVALRYLLHAPLPWPEELSQFLLVGISFFGMYRAFRANAHIRIQWLPKRPLAVKLLRIGGLVCVAVFLAYVGYGGLVLAQSAWHQPSTALRLPMAVPYLAIPASCALSLIAVAISIRSILAGDEDAAAPAEPHGGAAS